jgi:hypothetical protein
MKKYNVAIIGSRSYTDKESMWAYLDSKKHYIEMVISGNAKGADQLGQQWALERGIPVLIYPAKWYDDEGNYDRGAGFKRNHLIIKSCEWCIAYWDGVSTGTKNSLEWAEKLGKKIKVIHFTPPPPKPKEKRQSKKQIEVESLPEETESGYDDPVDWVNNI